MLTSAQTPAPYITIWKTNNSGGTSNTQIKIPASGAFDYTWEEIANPSHIGSGIGNDVTIIEFGSAGIYQVSMTPKQPNPFHQIKMPEGDRYKLIEIVQWGDIAWSSFEKAYSGASQLGIVATDIPNLENVTDMSSAFANSGISLVPNMNNWNTENVTNMQLTFNSATAFNQDIGNWNTENVLIMDYMFGAAVSFNQEIGNWNTYNVTSFNSMFILASSFNQDIGSWETLNITNFTQMFTEASSFNQFIGNWNTANAVTMKSMFTGASSFNQDIGSWNTENVEDMHGMFGSALAFNQDIGSWNTQNVSDMGSMFVGASSFNQDIETWDTANVSSMAFMFSQASSFNHDLRNWDLSNLNTPNGAIKMFEDSGIDCENYSLTLKGWANNPSTASNITLGARGMEYSPDAEPYRNILVDIRGWNIDGDRMGSCILSAESGEKAVLNIYPTFSKDFINITGLKGSESIKLFDVQGRLLYTFTTFGQKETLDLRGFSKGIYFLNIESGNGTRTVQRIIKQ